MIFYVFLYVEFKFGVDFKVSEAPSEKNRKNHEAVVDGWIHHLNVVIHPPR